MRRWAFDLARFGLWSDPVGWADMNESEADDAVRRVAQSLYSADPDHAFWKLKPLITRELTPPVRERGPVGKRHALYHCYPSTKNDHWQRNLLRLSQYVDIFDGERIAAVACGPGTERFDVAASELRLLGFEVMRVWNDPQLREVVSFLPLLCAAAQVCSPSDAVWYGHTKGNSTADGERGATIWRNAMYETQLGQWDVVEPLLRSNLFVGCHKMRWRANQCPFPSGLRVGDWMLAGTFYWFRAEVFQHARWRDVPTDRYGAEAWPSIVAQADEAASVYQIWPEDRYPTPSPYDPMIYPPRDVERFSE